MRPYAEDSETLLTKHKHADFEASDEHVFTVGGYAYSKEENKAELRSPTSPNKYEGEWKAVSPYPLDNIFYNSVVSQFTAIFNSFALLQVYVNQMFVVSGGTSYGFKDISRLCFLFEVRTNNPV